MASDHEPESVAKLTLVIDDDLVHRERVRALTQGTSAHAVVRKMLANDPANERVVASRRRVARVARASMAGSARTGRARACPFASTKPMP